MTTRDYIILGGPCKHEWVSSGGANACCTDPDCYCSVPVHECRWCSECDYGDNEDADEVRRKCAEIRE